MLRSRTHLFTRSFLACGLVMSSLALSHVGASAAVRAVDPIAGIPADYKDYQAFPACSDAVTSFCLDSWGIDLTNSGTFVTPPSELGIVFNAWVFSIKDYKTPSLAYEMRVNDQQELAPTVPAGTPFQFSINTGAFKPSPSLFTQAEVVAFDQNQVNGNWITSGTSKTASWPFALGCEADANCSNPTGQIDYQSFAQGVQFYEEPNALLESKKGMWVSTNAAVAGENSFEPQTMTWTVPISGPAKKADGTTNTLRYSTFLPDSFVQFAYGTTADVLATSLTTTRTDSNATTTLNATFTRVTTPQPGLLISIPTISLSGSDVASQSLHPERSSRYSTAPRIKIKPKSKLLAAPLSPRASRAGSGALRVSARAVRGATKYQAMCSKGATTVFASGKRPSITVTGLTSGKWSCSIRGVKKVGGKWARAAKVSVASS